MAGPDTGNTRALVMATIAGRHRSAGADAPWRRPASADRRLRLRERLIRCSTPKRRVATDGDRGRIASSGTSRRHQAGDEVAARLSGRVGPVVHQRAVDEHPLGAA